MRCRIAAIAALAVALLVTGCSWSGASRTAVGSAQSSGVTATARPASASPPSRARKPAAQATASAAPPAHTSAVPPLQPTGSVPQARIVAHPVVRLTPLQPPLPTGRVAFDPGHPVRIAVLAGHVLHLTENGGGAWRTLTVPQAVYCRPGDDPAAAAWRGGRLYVASGAAGLQVDHGGTWTTLSSPSCGDPGVVGLSSFSVSPSGRWAMTLQRALINGGGNWVVTGVGNQARLTNGMGGTVWATAAGYLLWGGRDVGNAPEEIRSFRLYASTSGAAWTAIAGPAGISNPPQMAMPRGFCTG